MEKEPKQGISKGVLLIIIILCLLLGLTSGYIVHDKLSNKEETKTEQKDNKEEKKDNNIAEEKEEETKEETKEESKKENVKSEKKSVSINLDKECINSSKKCSKEYTLSNNDKNVTINTEIKTISNNEFDQIITINGKSIYKHEARNYDGPYMIHGIALLDNNVLVIEIYNPGYSGPSSNFRIFYDADLEYKEIKTIYDTEYDFNNPNNIESKEGTYHTCEVRTCDDQTKRTYKYIIDENKKITSTLEKEENKFCSAQC